MHCSLTESLRLIIARKRIRMKTTIPLFPNTATRQMRKSAALSVGPSHGLPLSKKSFIAGSFTSLNILGRGKKSSDVELTVGRKRSPRKRSHREASPPSSPVPKVLTRLAGTVRKEEVQAGRVSPRVARSIRVRQSGLVLGVRETELSSSVKRILSPPPPPPFASPLPPSLIAPLPCTTGLQVSFFCLNS